MQNQNYWNKSCNAAGFLGLNAGPDGTSCSISLDIEPVVPNNELFAYSQSINNSSNLLDTNTIAAVMNSTVVSPEDAGIDIISESSLSVGNNWENSSSLIEQTVPSFVESHINQQDEQSKGHSQLLQHELPVTSGNSASYFSSELPTMKQTKRTRSLPPRRQGSKRKFNKATEIQTSYDMENCEKNSSNSSCDPIGSSDGSEALSKQTWANSSQRKPTTSVASSEKGITSLINKIFTDNQLQHYRAFKKKKTKTMDDRKERFKCLGVEDTFKSFTGRIAGTPLPNSTIFENEVDFSKSDDSFTRKSDDKMQFLIKKHKTDMSTSESEIGVNSSETQLIDLIANPLPKENSSFFVDISTNSQPAVVFADPNQQNLIPLDLLNEGAAPEDVLVSIKNQFCGSIEIDKDTNISTEDFANDDISKSLETIFTVTHVSNINNDTLYPEKGGQSDEIALNFVPESRISSVEPCLNVSIEDSEEMHTAMPVVSLEGSKIEQNLFLDSKEKSGSLEDSEQFECMLHLGDNEIIVELCSDDSHSQGNKLNLESSSQDIVPVPVDYIDNHETVMYLDEKGITMNASMSSASSKSEQSEKVLHIPIDHFKHEIESSSKNGETVINLPMCERTFCDDDKKISTTSVSGSKSQYAKETEMLDNLPFVYLEPQETKLDLGEHEDASVAPVTVVDLENCESILCSVEKGDNKQSVEFISTSFYENQELESGLEKSEGTLALDSFQDEQSFKDGEKITYVDSDYCGNEIRREETEVLNVSVSHLQSSDTMQVSEELDLESVLCSGKSSVSHENTEVLQNSVSHLNGGEYFFSLDDNFDVKSSSKAKKSFKSPVKESLMDIDNASEVFSTVDPHYNMASTFNQLSSIVPNLEMKSPQKSRKSFSNFTNLDERPQKLPARQNLSGFRRSSSLSSNSNSRCSSDSCDRHDCIDSSSSDDESDNMPSKRRKFASSITESRNDSLSTADYVLIPSNYSNTQAKCTAMKTFKKPFTVAKKSVTEKTAFKTIIQSYFGVRTAMKTFNKSSSVHNADSVEKEGSAIIISLQEKSDIDLSPEELSTDETKTFSGSWSPMKKLILKSVCCCSAAEVPCICSGEELQLKCEAEDTVDGNTVPCSKSVSKQCLLTPSPKIKHKAFCDNHLFRLRNHHCCPKCGVFCTQGVFLHCSYTHPMKGGKQSHFFHTGCFLIPGTGSPPSCPHCCKFSDFKQVQLSLKEEQNTSQTPLVFGDEEENITSDLTNYSILMSTVNKEVENLTNGDSRVIPPQKELHSMIMAVTREKSLRLRPTGKCLFNPIRTGDVKKVIQLIVNGVDPNHKFDTHKNNTPLHVAAFYGFTGIVHVLLQYGALIDTVNDDLETPLILAVEKNQIAVVRYLIFAGAQIDVKNENGLTAFHVASKNNFKEIAMFLFNTGKFDINIQDEGGWTPLVWACEHNHVHMVKWFLELGADTNIRDNEGNTALHWAACSGDSEILKMLLEKGCNISFVNERKDSALHIAARKDNYGCVKLLLARDASLDCKNNDGETPIMCCVKDSKSFKIITKHSLNSTKTQKNPLQHHVVYRDISRGLEVYPIQAVNEVDQQEFMMNFRYVTQNCFSPNMSPVETIDSIQVCHCKDNCNSLGCTCTRMTRCWYDMDGCLISDVDLCDPPSIYECNKTCHCPKTCINRVVQKGLRIPLQLFRTQSRGWGVRTLKNLPKGAFVCEYIGEVVTGSEIEQRNDDNYLFDLDSKNGDYCLDGQLYGNVARFINHSCEPNLLSIRVFVQHQDQNFPRIAFFTMRNIQAFEELCFDYGTEFWIAKCRTVLCTCNSRFCKYSKDSIDITLQTYASEKESQMLD